jgi:hypothetical protein
MTFSDWVTDPDVSSRLLLRGAVWKWNWSSFSNGGLALSNFSISKIPDEDVDVVGVGKVNLVGNFPTFFQPSPENFNLTYTPDLLPHATSRASRYRPAL